MLDDPPAGEAAASAVKDAAAVVETAVAVVEDAAAVVQSAAEVVQDVAAITDAAPFVERRRRPRRARHHEARVAWKHLAIYAPIVVLVTLLGAVAIWSFVERQSLVIAPEPLPRVTLIAADPRAPLTASWVRLLTAAEMEPALVPVGRVETLQGVVALCNLQNISPALAAALAEHLRRGGALALLGTPPAQPIGPLHLSADHGKSDNALRLSEAASPILARLTPGYELPVRPATVAFLNETPQMRVDARWRMNARAVAMHMEVSDARVLWLGLDPQAIVQPENSQVMLMLRTAFRWLAGQPVSDGAAGEAAQAKTMTPEARRRARSERFAFSVERLRDAGTFGIRMANRGERPIENPTVQVWLPPGVTQVALGGDWIMKRRATISGNQQDGACLVSLPTLGRNEERVMKLRIVAARR